MNKIIQKLNYECKPGDLLIYETTPTHWFHIGEIQSIFFDLRITDNTIRLHRSESDDVQEVVLSIT